MPAAIPPAKPADTEPPEAMPTHKMTKPRGATASRREVHRKQGAPKTLFSGPGGGIFQLTQNGGVRRTSKGEQAQWQELGIAIAWIAEPTPELLEATSRLNRETNQARRERRGKGIPQ
jgi:hypothetical protein